MTEEQIALARRAVACKRWRWMPGMRAVGRNNFPAAWFRVEKFNRRFPDDWTAALPDLQDPATLGCLLALVREAWGNPLVGVRGWLSNEEGEDLYEYYEVLGLDDELTADTEAHALVAALEAAP